MRAAVRLWIYYMAGTLDTAASISFACWCCMLLLLLLLLLLHAAAIVAKNTEMSHVQIKIHINDSSSSYFAVTF